MKKKVIILIDGNSYLYRVYYARLKNTNKNILCFQVIYNILYIFKKILINLFHFYSILNTTLFFS